MVLWNIRRYIHLQTEAVQTALVVGLGTGFKPATVARMRELGWDVPDSGRPGAGESAVGAGCGGSLVRNTVTCGV